MRGGLSSETALIGFCGAPWTVASYMIAGKGTPDQAPIRLTAYRDPDFFGALIDRLVAASADYLVGQLEAGAQAVQIFEALRGRCRRSCSNAGRSSRSAASPRR